ncbi:glycosyltransferase family 2 protein [Micromonospora sp. C51]|nr:glycosyltransferase family 2 protein [Micromonospora sp. C51]
MYNEEKYIGEMIDSVRRQSYRDWELLFVDDGSSDSTGPLIAEAARSDKRIKLVAYGRKLGKVAAFNRAFGASTGEVILHVGGDDVVPPDSFARRVSVFHGLDPAEPAVAFFKLMTFSENARFDNMVLPRGTASSRSGGSITINRPLADKVFPVDESLACEDIWWGYAAEDLATTVVEDPHIVLHYRIHTGNSNPRALSFNHMTQATYVRHRSYKALLDARQLNLSKPTREQLQRLWEAEQFRYAGKPFQVLFRTRLSMIDRLAMASAASPLLYSIRSRFYRQLSGRRGR